MYEDNKASITQIRMRMTPTLYPIHKSLLKGTNLTNAIFESYIAMYEDNFNYERNL